MDIYPNKQNTRKENVQRIDYTWKCHENKLYLNFKLQKISDINIK